MAEKGSWRLKFENFEKAYARLKEAVVEVNKDPSNLLLQAGFIRMYDFAFALAWKTLKQYLEEEGFDVPSPRKTIREAFRAEYIKNGELWLSALDSRNRTAHIYNEDMSKEVVKDILEKYLEMLGDLYSFLKKEYE